MSTYDEVALASVTNRLIRDDTLFVFASSCVTKEGSVSSRATKNWDAPEGVC